jgi:hypothetical protein
MYLDGRLAMLAMLAMHWRSGEGDSVESPTLIPRNQWRRKKKLKKKEREKPKHSKDSAVEEKEREKLKHSKDSAVEETGGG